eukprot:5145541-Amphidinium_carterae.1
MKSLKHVGELCEVGEDATAQLMGRAKKGLLLLNSTVFDATLASLLEDKHVSVKEKARLIENTFKQLTKVDNKFGWQTQSAMNKFFIGKASEIISRPDV